MFNIGMTELAVILVIALLVFGPKRLPELARSLGRAMGEFRRASSDLREHFLEASSETRVDLRAADRKPEAKPREGGGGGSEAAASAGAHPAAGASGDESGGEQKPAAEERAASAPEDAAETKPDGPAGG